MPGPLTDVRVLELAGLGPVPFAGMVLADLGAEVIRVDRPGESWHPTAPELDLLGRGKRSLCLDLKRSQSRPVLADLVARSDILLEGFRPGVAERLGIAPDECARTNPRLVYGRMTGWGQTGPLAGHAGHDVNYLALTGVLHAIGTADAPVPPLNLVGDYGGGGMLLVTGVLAALLNARLTGQGQTVDAAIVDGAALLATEAYGFLHAGAWQDRRAANLLDGSAPNYGVYRTADDRHLAVGPLEPKFWQLFTAVLGGAGNRTEIAARIASKTQAEWLAVFADHPDACVAPVLSMTEAAANGHPQLRARETFVTAHGVPQPAPAPRFTGTPATLTTPPPRRGEHTREILAESRVPEAETLLANGTAVQAG